MLEDWQRDFWWEALEVDPATGLRVYSEVGLGLPRKNGKSVQASRRRPLLPRRRRRGRARGLRRRGRPQPGRHRARPVPAHGPAVPSPLAPRVASARRSSSARATAGSCAACPPTPPSSTGSTPTPTSSTSSTPTGPRTSTPRSRPAPVRGSSPSRSGSAPRASMPRASSSSCTPACSTDPASSRTAARCWSTATAPTASSSGGTGHRGTPTSRTPRSGWPPTPPPGSGTARTSSQEYARLKARGALLDWRRYHLNQFVGTEEAWLPEGAWTSCRVGDPDPADPLHGLDPALPVGVGIDKGQTSDLSAIVVAQRQGERVVVRSRVFPPHPATGRVNTESMRAYLRELRGRFPLPQARDEKTGPCPPGSRLRLRPLGLQRIRRDPRAGGPGHGRLPPERLDDGTGLARRPSSSSRPGGSPTTGTRCSRSTSPTRPRSSPSGA